MRATLDHLLEESAALHPDNIAVEDPERQTRITYRDLRSLAALVKDALVREGVGPGRRVGLCLDKSIASVAAIFGILEAGAAYVPVDASAPAARNDAILTDCEAAVVIGDEARLAGLAGLAPESDPLAMLSAFDGDVRLGRAVKRFDPGADAPLSRCAYILYTSGSTGTPKGVVHTHESALGFVDWCSRTFAPTPEDRFSSHAPFHFDLSILDLYVPLKHGATLVLIGEEAGKQPRRLAPLFESCRFTVWYSTPSILTLLRQYGHLDRQDASSLRLLLFAGEVFPPKHFAALRELWPHPAYFNLYGPTETNVCTAWRCPASSADDATAAIPIGRVCDGDRGRVVDATGNEVEAGSEGELLISGATVMTGYWRRPELNSTVFTKDADGVAWYRTGDIVRSRADGALEFIGRRDRMVKRRGFRIELGEIEAGLYRHDRVTEAGVVARIDDEGDVTIRAFLACDGDSPGLLEMKRFCAANLPSYMIPDGFTFLEALPKTSTDKLDYQALQEL